MRQGFTLLSCVPIGAALPMTATIIGLHTNRTVVKETLETLGAMWAVFAVQSALSAAGISMGLLALSFPLSVEPWTLVTSVYAHGSLGHIVSNSIGLLFAGFLFQQITTRKRFHLFFVFAGILTGVSQVLLSLVVLSPTSVLGASGAIFALFGYIIAGNPVSQTLFDSVEINKWVLVIIFLGVAVAGTLLTASPQAALIGHGTGILIGLVCGYAGIAEP